MREVYVNTVIITSICIKPGKKFAFGLIFETKPRTVFIPGWVMDAFEITPEDQGCEFECAFIDQDEARHPMVLSIIEDDMLSESEVIGEYEGRPGQSGFAVSIENKIAEIYGRPS